MQKKWIEVLGKVLFYGAAITFIILELLAVGWNIIFPEHTPFLLFIIALNGLGLYFAGNFSIKYFIFLGILNSIAFTVYSSTHKTEAAQTAVGVVISLLFIFGTFYAIAYDQGYEEGYKKGRKIKKK